MFHLTKCIWANKKTFAYHRLALSGHSLSTDLECGCCVQDGDHTGQVHFYLKLWQNCDKMKSMKQPAEQQTLARSALLLLQISRKTHRTPWCRMCGRAPPLCLSQLWWCKFPEWPRGSRCVTGPGCRHWSSDSATGRCGLNWDPTHRNFINTNPT